MKHCLYWVVSLLTSTFATFIFPATPGLSIHAQDRLLLDYESEFNLVNITMLYLPTPDALAYDVANIFINPVPGTDQKLFWPYSIDHFVESGVFYPVDCFFRLTEYGNDDNAHNSVHFSIKESTEQPPITWSLPNQPAVSSSKPSPSQSQSMGLLGGAFGICLIILAILLWHQKKLIQKMRGMENPIRSIAEGGSEMFLQGHDGLRYASGAGPGGKWVFGRPVYEVPSTGDDSMYRAWSDGKTSYVVAHELVSDEVVPELTGEAKRQELPSRLCKTPVLDKTMVAEKTPVREETGKALPAAPGWG